MLAECVTHRWGRPISSVNHKGKTTREGSEKWSIFRRLYFSSCFPPVFPDRKVRLARDVITSEGGLPNPCLAVSLPAKTSSLSDPSWNHNDTIATETSQRCLYHPDRSRVCNRSGSPARYLQNHGNTALTAGWYVSHVQLISAHLDAVFQ